MNRRLRLLLFTLRRGSLGGSGSSWLFNCFSPRCEALARRIIEEEVLEGEFRRFKFRGNPGYFYYPAQFSIQMLFHAMSEQFYPKNWHHYEIPQTRVEPSDVVMDCGSAEGLFAFMSFRRARQVIAVEPLPEYQRALEKTFHDAPNVRIARCALGNEAGKAFIQGNELYSKVSNQPIGTEIDIVPLDKLCRDLGVQCTYIKADVEGWEQQLLEGGAETIRRQKPKIAITTYHHQNDSAAMAAYLRTLVPEYQFLHKGIEAVSGKSVMLHAWVDR